MIPRSTLAAWLAAVLVILLALALMLTTAPAAPYAAYEAASRACRVDRLADSRARVELWRPVAIDPRPFLVRLARSITCWVDPTGHNRLWISGGANF